MKIHIRAHSTHVPPGLRAHVERRLAFALGRFERQVRRVFVRLSGASGPMDRSCQIAVELSTSQMVRAERTESGDFAAISSAADCVSSGVTRAIHRRRRTGASLSHPH